MAELTRWSPFGTLRREDAFGGMLSLRNAMDRLLEDAFVRPGDVFNWMGAWTGGYGALAVDLYETGNDCVVKAVIPGVRPEDIDISVQGNLLTIRGETKAEEQEERGSYHLRERRSGTFFRQVQLPVPVVAEKSEARFENGILTLHLPKAEEARERKIQIGTGQKQEKAGRAA